MRYDGICESCAEARVGLWTWAIFVGAVVVSSFLLKKFDSKLDKTYGLWSTILNYNILLAMIVKLFATNWANDSTDGFQQFVDRLLNYGVRTIFEMPIG